MKITQEVLDSLTALAKTSPRLRMHLDLRNSPEDASQRMLNAIEPGTSMPIHRHRHRTTSETIVCLRGRFVEEYYNEAGELFDSIELTPGGPCAAVNVPSGHWHSLRSLESGTVLLAMKNGSYEPLGGEDILK